MTARRLTAEFVGTALLLVAIVGSGLATSVDGTAATQLFQHAVVVGGALVALILTFGHVSGAHFNPAVTLVDAWFGGLERALAVRYVVAQCAGAVTGVVVANLVSAEAAVSVATTRRAGIALVSSEALATFGLLLVIFGVVRSGNLRAVPGAVGAYIGAAIFFTPSAALANPAVTIARSLSDTYTGIAPVDVPAYVLAQLAGAAVAAVLIRWLFAPTPDDAAHVVVDHPTGDRADLGAPA